MRGELAPGIGVALLAIAWIARTLERSAVEVRRVEAAAPQAEPGPALELAPVPLERTRLAVVVPVVPEPAPAERAIPAASTISGIVFGPDSRPVPRAYLKFVWDDRGREQEAYGSTSADGRFALAVSDPHAHGDLLAYVHRHTLAPAALTGIDAGERGLELTLGWPAYFDVEVRGPDEQPMTCSAPAFFWQLAGHSVQDYPGGVADRGRPLRWARSPVPFVVYIAPQCAENGYFGPFDPAQIGDVLVLHTHPYPRVRGEVVHEGNGIAGARILMREARDADSTDAEEPWRDMARSDERGRFEFCRVRAGTYELRTFALPFGTGLLEPVALDSEHDVEGLTIELTRPPGSIEGRVLLPRGHEPTEIWLSASSGQGYRSLRGDGSFLLPDLEAGPCRVEVLQGERDPERVGVPGERWIEPWVDEILRGPSWVPQELVYRVEVPSGGVAHLDIDLASPPLCRLEGRLRLDGAAPRLRPRETIGIELPLIALDRGIDWEYDAAGELSSEGAFHFGVAEPGRYRLRIELALDGSKEGRWLVRDHLALAPGATPWKLEIATGSLRLLPVDADHPLWGNGPAAVWTGPGELTIRVLYPELDELHGTRFYPLVPAGKVRLESPEGDTSPTLEYEIRAGATTEVRWAR